MTKRSYDISGFEVVPEDLKNLPDELTKHTKGVREVQLLLNPFRVLIALNVKKLFKEKIILG